MLFSLQNRDLLIRVGLIIALSLSSVSIYSQVSPGDSLLKLNENPAYPWEAEKSSPLYLYNPSNLKTTVEYDGKNNQYIIYQKVGGLNYRMPVYMSPEEYRRFEFNQAMRDYWDANLRGDASGFRSSLIPQIEVGGETFDKIFGSNIINIVPQGSAELVFGLDISHTENPTLSEELRTIPTFDFEEKIQMNVTGTVGDKMQLGINYNTEAMFEFENRTKLEYSGKEDEIIKKVEAGDVSLPLNGTLINGSYSLFGLKTELQFGKLDVTTVFSQQKGESSTITVEGGAQLTDFEISADEYEANKHFFLSHFFRDNFDAALANLPEITSGVNIEKIEVWVTNTTGTSNDVRNFVAFADLAENQENIYNSVPAFQGTAGAPPSNDCNGLYNAMTTTYSSIRDMDKITDALSSINDFGVGVDYEKIENARKLSESEYVVNEKLGYISLNTALNNDEVLAVAYQYTYNGQVYKVGEFSTDGITAPDVLILKLIKGTTLSPRYPTWQLMMKNIYNLGSGGISSDDFTFGVYYDDDKTGTALNYLPDTPVENKILLQLVGLDQINTEEEVEPDGVFDYVEGATIMEDKGRVIFPVCEPFGSHLKKYITSPDQIEKYVFSELYDSTKSVAKQKAEKDKYLFKGQYKSTYGSDISLNAVNIPEGSVIVTANGVTLTENVDYTVDYNLGTVKIINSSIIESGTTVQISLESNQYYGLKTKLLTGVHLNYNVSDKLKIGATAVHLTEKPYTTKVSYGEDPISNTVYGLDLSYNSESKLLTKAIDALPFIETKAPSTINFFGEYAYLDPGHSKAITSNGEVYIDDFESSETSLDMRAYTSWSLASIPQGQSTFFPEAALNNDLRSGYNRARLAWYTIDPLFLENGSTTPSYIKSNPDLQSSNYVREIYENEIFPEKESSTGLPTTISVLNVAFYPSERGPYNFDTQSSGYSAGINEDGSLKLPSSRWGGMMREISTTNFESANIQYIKFWLMDPFAEDSELDGGDLYIDLGNVSEDILRDSRKQYENGLPTTSLVTNVDTTSWGRVPTVQAVVHAFDSDSDSRQYQDVGLDGLSDSDENTFFDNYLSEAGAIVSPEVLTEIKKDPSNDNFHYYRGSDYDLDKLGILDRYKHFNGPDQNSPTSEMSDEPYSTSGSTLPNEEDINLDNTLSETESYYQYHISLRPEDMVVNRNNIVDEVEYTATLANGEQSTVKWYQFKIPISDYESTVGNISDFTSIRFMRLFLRDFSDDIVLRFARLELVRSGWRKYNLTFFEGGERITTPQDDDTSFDLSSVSIEENANKTPVNYVLPPGVSRETDPTSTLLTQLDEQSMVMKVVDVADGDARAAYKTMSLNMLQYKKLKMEVHAEAVSGYTLKDDELTAFIRIGSDYKSNFYEYEIPLKVTPPGTYSNNSDIDREIVWPEDNKFIIDLSQLVDIKQERNIAMNVAGSTLSSSDVYTIDTDTSRISVCGNPSLSNVKVILLGIRNPIKTRDPDNDDGASKSVEIWVDELRLADFKEDDGWAANGQLQMNLADLGTLNLVGQMSTPGWGSIDQNISERSTEEAMEYDFSSNLELGKLFPEKANVRIPVYLGLSESRVRPKYDPTNTDVLLEESLDDAETKEARDSLLNIVEERSSRKTITISNAGITSKKEKSHIWDLSNLSASYSYSEESNSDIDTETDIERTYRGSITYNFETTSKNFAPFQKVKFLDSPWLRLIKDLNINLFPQNIIVRNEVYRYYNEVKARNLTSADLIIEPTFTKEFEWNRFYDIKYDITKQLKFDFTANVESTIDEPSGGVDKDLYPDLYDAWRDSVMTNLKQGGRTTNYYHILSVNYNVPVNKLPYLSWLTTNLTYGARYDWDAGTIYPDSLNINLGNSISNSADGQVTVQANLAGLYSKVKFLKEVENMTKPGAKRRMSLGYEDVTYQKNNVPLKAGRARIVNHNLKTKDVTVTVTDADGAPVKGKYDIVSDTQINFTPDADTKNANIIVKGKVEKKPNPLGVAGRYLVRALMGIRNFSATYTINQEQYLPGYMPGSSYLGGEKLNGMFAPGFQFITGLTDESFFDKALSNGWLTTDTQLSTAATFSRREQFSGKMNLEPFPGLRIDITANRRLTNLTSAYYIADDNSNFPDSTRNRTESGSFTISIISWGTAFEKITDKNSYKSPAFERFKDYTEIISQRRASERIKVDPGYDPTEDVDEESGSGYAGGYGLASNEVLIPAFLAAYTNRDPNTITLSEFPSLAHVMPNWRISFDGLTKYEAVRKIFNSVSISHQYRSTYTIGSYNTNLDFDPDENGISRVKDLSSNFIPKYDISTVTISEQFSPLIYIDLGWKNSLTTRLEYRKSRTVTLNLSNDQVTDLRNDQITFGAGYRFDDVSIVLKSHSGQRSMKSDLNVNLDLSIRNLRTVAHKLVEDVDQAVSGQKTVSVGATADYALSDRFKLELYVDYTLSDPFVATTYLTSNTSFGFSVEFTLAQ